MKTQDGMIFGDRRAASHEFHAATVEKVACRSIHADGLSSSVFAR
ncbi:hypothetical protein [Variovorax sp. DAIF25]